MSYTEFMVACMFQVKRFYSIYCEADYNFYNHLALTPGLGELEVLLLILCRAASSAALSHTVGFRVGGGVHDSYTFQCGLVGSFTSPGIDTR